MKLLFLTCLLGALIGGFPGGIIAFIFAAGMDIGATAAESICFIVNLLLSVGGAFIAMFLTKKIHGQGRYQLMEIVLPLVLGLLCGFSGYALIDWAMRHAEPPL